MRIFGLNITRSAPQTKALSQVSGDRGGWLPIVRESFSGAWQQNVEINNDVVLTYSAVFACMTLIASDISKMPLRLVKLDSNGVWTETTDAAVSPVLRKPNPYQNRIQFFENWLLCKLSTGNAYILKQRGNRNEVVAMHVLDPHRVQVYVADSGDVFYKVQDDDLAGLQEPVYIPASEIIHDRFNCLYHPLIGMSPIAANGLSAMQGISIQNNATNLFKNGSMPGGILTAPGRISEAAAAEMKAAWESNFGGAKFGKVAVLGDGLKYEQMAINAVDSQLIEQLKWTAEVVCSTFHVPPYKIGVGAMPSYNNVQALNIEYMSQGLQRLIEDAELCLDEGFGLSIGTGVEFNVKSLLRMDSVTQMNVIKEAIGSGIMSPNEGRRELDLQPVKGGDSPYLQQQNYSLEALAKRDAQDPLSAKPEPVPAPAPEASDPTEEPDEEPVDVRAFAARILSHATKEIVA
jgi:HK97 family phage portal protein